MFDPKNSNDRDPFNSQPNPTPKHEGKHPPLCELQMLNPTPFTQNFESYTLSLIP